MTTSNFMNFGSSKPAQASISEHDKHFLKMNVFTAMDALITNGAAKVLVSSLEHIIYNMAQVDYLSWN